MGYTALEKMKERLRNDGFVGGYPKIPPLDVFFTNGDGDLTEGALYFIREDCAGLRFDTKKLSSDEEKKALEDCTDNRGRSKRANQIPYRMQMDIDRLCLERTLGSFLKEGTTQAAYLVYFCYLEMFWSGKESGEVRRMIEQLSEFEKNSSPLLAAHRDHFVHSVYVFAIGLAVFHKSELFRNSYAEFYSLDLNDHSAAHHFLKYWGFTALFHDLGYPFELSFCQVRDYFSKQNTPGFFISYNKRTAPKKQTERDYAPFYHKLRARKKGIPDPETADELFAGQLTKKLYESFRTCKNYQLFLSTDTYYDSDSVEAFYYYLKGVLEKKPSDPTYFKNNIDHAYFSAYLVLHHLWNPKEKPAHVKQETMDALTAILLHNSLLKYTILKDDSDHRLKMETHPLAFILMLCDELQCWNRFGYGKNTRKEKHPFGCKLNIEDNQINVDYLFEGKPARRKPGDDGSEGDNIQFPKADSIQKFLSVNDSNSLGVKILTLYANRPNSQGEPLSECSFLNTFQLAVLLNSEYQSRQSGSKGGASPKDAQANDFNSLSLEYKLANLYQVQQFAEHLNKLSCFFTDRVVAFAELPPFTDDQLEKIGNWEHKAWEKRKRDMGWSSGKEYLDPNDDPIKYGPYDLRECMRMHQYINEEYGDLPDDTQKNDTEPIKKFRDYMKKNYNVRIYKLFDVNGITSGS